MAEDTTKDGPEGRGQEQGARRGIQQSTARARVNRGQEAPSPLTCVPCSTKAPG